MHGSGSDSLSSDQRPIPFVLMRGGTSKAVFLSGSSLPEEAGLREKVILRIFGSPDPRQIDGLGGADLLTSKLAIIDPPSRRDADVDYTFAQVSITEPVVDFDINCGNISAAVGAYAVDEGLVEVIEPVTTVRIHNTNTAKVFWAEVPVIDGRAAVEGDQAIDGVPGTGAPISLDFSTTAGGTTGSLLPTGNHTDVLETSVEVTIVDLAMLSVFFEARAVGMKGTEGPGDMTPEHFDAIAAIKKAAAARVGIDNDGLLPVPVVVSEPAGFRSFATGEDISATEVDLTARVIGGRPPMLHKAYPGTVSACTGVAAMLESSVVARNARHDQGGWLRIGHPSGTMTVQATVGGSKVTKAAYLRTARRIAEGTTFIPRRVWR